MYAANVALVARYHRPWPPPTGKTPEVIVSTSPMCLVSINGQPNLTQVADGLFAVANANCDLFTTSADNAWWLLASGRWFTSTDLMNGPWTYSKPTTIPAAFAQIDPHGTWGNVLASVPNTPQSTEAVYQQTIPHVATLDRALAKAKLSTIGGPARFKPIAGTTMQYAANASSPLIYCKEMYYLCDTAAWFVANAPNGPWTLCDAVPEEIYTIPPSCPIYAATYVQVYNSDADSVTFGFTAGYMNSYENDGTVAYGTGYTYPGSIGAQDLVLGNNSDITDDDTWDTYGGYPNTYGYWPSYGADYGGWGFCGYPGWGDYGLYPGAYWSGDGWWGGGVALWQGGSDGLQCGCRRSLARNVWTRVSRGMQPRIGTDPREPRARCFVEHQQRCSVLCKADAAIAEFAQRGFAVKQKQHCGVTNDTNLWRRIAE